MIHLNLTEKSNFIPDDFNIEKIALWAGGEIDLRINDIDKWKTIDDHCCTIYTRLNNSEDIMKLFMASNLFKKVHVLIPYLPYARQDRICKEGEPFSLRVMSSLLNSQKYKSVKVFDPHSNIAEQLIHNIIPLNNHEFVEDVLENICQTHQLNLEQICLVSPDAGAQKKLYNLADYIGGGVKTLPCFKHRSYTGNIRTIYIPEEKLDPSLTYVLVDDICDKGSTSIALTESLKEKGAENIHFVVSHGIFYGNAITNLYNCGIKNIWTTSSIKNSQFFDGKTYTFDVYKYMQ